MINNMKYIIYYLIIINTISLIIFGIDKYFAKKGLWRIKEITLILISIIGGSIGSIICMKIFHHKTLKPLFKYGIPLIIISQIILTYYLINSVF